MKRKGKGERYLSLRHWLLKSPAWRSLPAVSRALYLELSHFGGVRQGMAKGLAGLKPEAQGAAGLRRTRSRAAVGAMSTSHRAARRGGQRGADAVTGYPEPGQPPKQAITIHPEIRIAVDLDHRRVVFDRWGEIKGAGAELLMFLADTFRRSASAELAPERYPFARTRDLLHELQLDSEEAYRWLMSPRTLEQWRWQGKGPKYLKIGARVVYRLADVEAFESENLHLNTTGSVGAQFENTNVRHDR